MEPITITWKNFEELNQNIAQLISQWANQNYTPKTWFFSGDLGAGKSTFIRHLIQSLSNANKVPSPTYSLMEPYQTPIGQVAHFDLYRLDSDQDFFRYGLTEYAEDPSTICLIEWPERISQNLKNLFGTDHAEVHVSVNQDHTLRTAQIKFI